MAYPIPPSPHPPPDSTPGIAYKPAAVTASTTPCVLGELRPTSTSENEEPERRENEYSVLEGFGAVLMGDAV
jgi:hypothetical protein